MESTYRGIPAEAVVNAASALTERMRSSGDWSNATPGMARAALEAAYLDIRIAVAREVLEEVVEALREMSYDDEFANAPAKFIEREFGL